MAFCAHNVHGLIHKPIIVYIYLWVFLCVFLSCQIVSTLDPANQPNPALLYKQASSDYVNQNYSDAQSKLEMICPNANGKMEHCYLYAKTLNQLSLNQKAIDILVAQLQDHPGEFRFHRLLAYIYLVENKLDLSIFHANQALILRVNDKTTLLNLGRALDLSGKPLQAQHQYNKILESYPHDALTLHYQSLAWFRVAQYKEAWASQKKITNPDPKHKCYLAELSWYVLSMIESKKMLEDCIQSNPDRITSRSRLALSYLLNQDYEKSCEMANSLERSNINMLPILMVCNYHLGHYQTALSFAERLDAVQKQNINFIYYTALIYSKLDNCNDAIDHFRQIIEFYTPQKDLLYNMGVCYEQTNNAKEAIKYYNLACKATDQQACQSVQRLEQSR